jgi:hypothetical protein
MEDRFSLRGTTAIVVAGVLLAAALNGSATAATGLLAPGLRTIELPGRAGLLIDPNTHVPGLVAAKTPRRELRVRPDPDPAATVTRLRQELREAHAARAHANGALAMLIAGLALLALGSRSPWLARASVLAAPATIGLGLWLRSSLLLFFGGLVVALVFAASRRAFVPLCFLVVAAALVVLWHSPVTNALATIGPHPDGGRRFYGLTNQVETLLLPTALVAGLAAAPLALFTVGWSKAGADGGGVLVYGAGYAMLGLRAYGRVTWRRALVAAAAVAAVGLVLVAVDAATGGSSHVTRALDTGLPGDIAHRLHVSAQGATRSWGAFVQFAVGAVALVRLARLRPRPALLDAMLVALATSLLVNDTPQDVLSYGALGAISLLAFERTR